MKKSSVFFKKFSQFCDTMSEVETMADDLKSDVEKVKNFDGDLDKVEFQKKLVARFNKLAKKFTEVADTLVEASNEIDDAEEQVPVDLTKKFARVKRSFGELQEVMDTLTGEVSKASAVAAGSVDVPQEPESIESQEDAEIQVSFSKVVKTASSKISNLFNKFSSKLSDVADDADELVDKFSKDECAECNDSEKFSTGDKIEETESTKSDEEIVDESTDEQSLDETNENNFSKGKKITMSKKFEKCPDCGQEPCACNESEAGAPVEDKVAELAEKMEVVTSDIDDLMKEEQVPEEVKENVVAAFTEMAENLDKYLEEKSEDQTALAESFDKAEEAIKEFCGSVKSFSARRKANKIVKCFGEMPAIIESIVEAPTEETAETQKVETEVEDSDGKITVKEAGESLDKVIDSINGVSEIVKELGTSNFAKSLLRRARKITCFSQEDLEKKQELINKYFEEIKEDLDRDEIKPEDEVEDTEVEAKAEAQETTEVKPEDEGSEVSNFDETPAESDESKDEAADTVEEVKEDKSVEDKSEEVSEESAEFSDEATDEVAEDAAPVVDEMTENEIDETASESTVDDVQADEAQEDESEVQFGEDLTEETASVEDPALSVDSDVVEEVIGENLDSIDEDPIEDKSEEDISDNKIVQFSKSSKSSPASTYDSWIESMC